MKKQMIMLVLGIGMLMLQGCATIMSGTTKGVHIGSNPSGVDFQIDVVNLRERWSNLRTGVPFVTGTTPQMVILKRRAGFRKEYRVAFTGEHVKTKIVYVIHGITGWYYANLLLGGVPGFIVDFITGACDDPKDVYVRLIPKCVQ